MFFIPLVFESSQQPPGRMGKLKPTEVKCLAQVHTASQGQGRTAIKPGLTSRRGFLGTFLESPGDLLQPFFSTAPRPTPTEPIPWTAEGGFVHSGSQPRFHFYASPECLRVSSEQPQPEASLSLGLETVSGGEEKTVVTPHVHSKKI